jgi:hypothetical protein
MARSVRPDIGDGCGARSPNISRNTVWYSIRPTPPASTSV